jgi:hypothetical protein
MLRKREQPSRRKKVQTDATPGTVSPERGQSQADTVPSGGPGQPNIPPTNDLFAAPIGQEPAYGDIFASFLDLASRPQESEQTAHLPRQSMSGHGSALPYRRLSYLQQILIIAIVATAAVLTYTVAQRMMVRHGAPDEAASRAPVEDYPSTPPSAARTAPAQSEPNAAGARTVAGSVPGVAPLSLGVADKLYLAGDYENALLTYEKLSRRLPPSEEHQATRDFLTFRVAMCYRNADDTAQADAAFRTLSLSRPPILRALARYHQSLALMERGRYLEAAAKA